MGIPWHDDIIKWKHFPHYWPFVRGIHRSRVNSPHKGQWRGALMFCLICAWINSWVNNHKAGDLRCHLAHYDVTVMILITDALSFYKVTIIYWTTYRHNTMQKQSWQEERKHYMRLIYTCSSTNSIITWDKKELYQTFYPFTYLSSLSEITGIKHKFLLTLCLILILESPFSNSTTLLQ